MPGVAATHGDVTRIDLPMPFFLRDDPFVNFKNSNYNWNTERNITVLVKGLERQPSKHLDNAAENMEEESVGGCPLECPFDPNENFEEAVKPNLPETTFPGLDFSLNHYSSMELQTCRTLVKKIYDGDEETLQNLRLDRVAGKYSFANPIYVACDGSPNAKDLVMIGYQSTQMKNDLFLELRMMGPYKRQSTQLNLDLFLAYHQHLPNVIPSAVHKQVHAVYEKPHGQYPAAGTVHIEFLWTDPKVLFETPPPLTSFVKLTIKPKPGDANPFLAELWKEISTLDSFIEMMDSGDFDTEQSFLGASFLSSSLTDSPSKLMDDLKALFNQPSVPNWKKGLELSDSVENVLRRVKDLDRSDVDFTDKLWSILKNATHPNELRDCLRYVFTAVESKLYRPYLFPSNETLVSSILKQIGNSAMNFRSKMSSLNFVLEMVIDCGINKLYKDYCFILGMCKLADQSKFRTFVPKPKMIKESLMDVKKLHCMLEIICLSKDRLALSMTDQEAQIRTLLHYFSTNKVDWNHTFHFDVPYNAVTNFIIGSHPIYWNLKLESSNSLRIARTNAVLSKDFFIGHARKFYMSANGSISRSGFYLYVHRIAQRKI